jgi:hypothetical protein
MSDSSAEACAKEDVLSGFNTPNLCAENSTRYNVEIGSTRTCGRGLYVSWFPRWFTFVLVVVGAAQKRHLV